MTRSTKTPADTVTPLDTEQLDDVRGGTVPVVRVINNTIYGAETPTGDGISVLTGSKSEKLSAG